MKNRKEPPMQGSESNNGNYYNTNDDNNLSLRDGWNKLDEWQKADLIKEAHKADNIFIPHFDFDFDPNKHYAIPITKAKIGHYILEQINGKNFVLWDRDSDEWRIINKLKADETKKEKDSKNTIDKEIVYVPLINEQTRTSQITLADKPEESNSLMEIIKEIEEKSSKWLYIAPEEMPIFRIQIRMAVASWFLYIFDDPKIMERIAGLLIIQGTSGGGKKRWLTLLRMIAYRPIYLMNTQKIPSVYRMAEPWGTPSILIDEADQKETGSEDEWIQFINGRYDGTPIPRYNSSTQRIDTFRSFGLTALALRRSPKDEGITSRGIKINATISPIELPEIADEKMYEEFAPIRNKLLYLRLKYYGKIKLINRSGLPVEHSWRGKEALTLMKTLSQIDTEIDKDIEELSRILTLREVENLAKTFDGFIINEIYAFISDDNSVYEKKGNGIYFFQKILTGDDEKIYPLNLSNLSKKLNVSANEISRSIEQFKIATYSRFRIEGLQRPQRGVLMFNHLIDTDRIFSKYVPGYEHLLKQIADELAKQTLDIIRCKPEVEEYNQSVPHVPDVPNHDLSSHIYKNNNNIHTHVGGTHGTDGTNSPDSFLDDLIYKIKDYLMAHDKSEKLSIIWDLLKQWSRKDDAGIKQLIDEINNNHGIQFNFLTQTVILLDDSHEK